jgi:hypothetical protein
MDQQMRQFLEERSAASQWMGGGAAGAIRNFNFTGSEISGWTLVRAQRSEGTTPPSVLSVWRHGDATDEVISLRIVECTNAAAAREQLLEELGNFQSPVIQRLSGPNAVGDVAFGLGDTMILFVRANMVVVILNAGRKVVAVTVIARGIDALLRDRLA